MRSVCPASSRRSPRSAILRRYYCNASTKISLCESPIPTLGLWNELKKNTPKSLRAGEIEQIFYRPSGRVRTGVFQREPRESSRRGLLGKVHRQQTHLRALVNLERETVFRRFL